MIVYAAIDDYGHEGDRLLGIGATLDDAKAIAEREAELKGDGRDVRPWEYDKHEGWRRWCAYRFQRIEETEVEGYQSARERSTPAVMPVDAS